MFLRAVFLTALFFCSSAYAADSTALAMRVSIDCPIAAPFIPQARTVPAQDGDEIHIYDLHGFKVNRIQLSAANPVELDLVWVPVDKTLWKSRTVHLTLEPGAPRCFLSDWAFPAHTPGEHIEIRTHTPVQDLKVAFSKVPWDHGGKCPAPKSCAQLVKIMKTCEADYAAPACDNFIDSLKKLTPHYQCRRKFDTDPVPALWVCEEAYPEIMDELFPLVKSLRSDKAVGYYQSDFRSVLDGALAEEYDDEKP